MSNTRKENEAEVEKRRDKGEIEEEDSSAYPISLNSLLDTECYSKPD